MDIDFLIDKRNKITANIDETTAFLALILCAQRMGRSYNYFAGKYKLDYEWFDQKLEEAILGSYDSLEDSINFIEKKIPDSEDYPELWSTIAQDAVIIIIKIYHFIKENNKKHILAGFEIMDEAMDFYMQESEEVGAQMKYVEQLAIKELEWEIELFELIQSDSSIDTDILLQNNEKYVIPTYFEIFEQI